MSIASQKLQNLQERMNYTFKDTSLLINALTHSSFANEGAKKYMNHGSNERLEFLGDSILSMVVSEFLFKNYPNLPEGELTKTRANVVCAFTLSKCARVLGLGDFILLGKGEVLSGGRNRDSILADAFEAIIGAVFLDGGIQSAKEFILSILEDLIESSINGEFFMDFKTQLQELVQKGGLSVDYKIIKETGPDHNKKFYSSVFVGEREIAQGEGKTKKEAEQNAAKKAFHLILSDAKE